MLDYFKPVRRKLGVVTLAMACLFAAGWVRSDHRSDIVMYDLNVNDDNWGAISSYRQRLRWAHIFGDPDNLKESAGFQVLSYPVPPPSEVLLSEDYCRLEFLGFEFKLFPRIRGSLPPPFETLIAVPYWSIVLPLTLLSACLLLNKPRPKGSGPTHV